MVPGPCDQASATGTRLTTEESQPTASTHNLRGLVCFHNTKGLRPCHRPLQWAMGPQRDNRQPTQGPRGAPGIFGFGGNPCKTPPWEGLGGNGHTQRVPGWGRNHSPRKKSRETSWGTNPSTKSCFPAPMLGPKGALRPSGTQTLTWGSKNGVRGQRY